MFSEIEFYQAMRIGPSLDSPWPGDHHMPLYWVTRQRFVLEKVPQSAGIRVVADRHYQIFINGRRIARQRGFFNGDEYLFAQTWTKYVASSLQSGWNRIELVVRSDPWRNKNYRHYQPMAMLELFDLNTPDHPFWVTDASWDLATIEHWREQIALAGCETIQYDRVQVPTCDKAYLCGLPSDLDWTKARVLPPAEKDPPKFLHWNDSPKREDVITAVNVAACGTCEIPVHAMAFPVHPEHDHPTILRTEFEDHGGTNFSLSTSAMFRHLIRFNGREIVRFQDVPGKYNMPLPDWLMPRGRFTTQPGVNILEIEINTIFPWHTLFRATTTDLPVLQNMLSWTLHHDSTPALERQTIECSEAIGAKGTCESSLIRAKTENGCLSIHAVGSHRMFSVVDMGKLVRGYLRFRIQSASAGRVLLGYGFEQHHGCVDAYRMRIRACDILDISPGESTYEAFDIRLFRFIDFIFEGFDGEVSICDIDAIEHIFVDEASSSFDSNDIMTNTIFLSSRRTAQVCTDELYVDNVEREHAQWSDAIICGSLAGYYLFGEYRKAEKAMEEISLAQQPDGQLPGYAPGEWFPRIPLQCHMSLFAIAFCDHYQYTGNTEFGRRMLDVIEKMISHWQRYRRSDGLLADLHTVFVDWGSHIYSYGRDGKGPTGALTTMNCYFLGVIRKTAEMARHLRENTKAKRYDALADNLQQAIQGKLYIPEAECFRDGVDNELAEKNISQTANALAVLFGAAPKGKEPTILHKVFGANRPEDIIPANAFFSWQVGQAMFNFDCDDLAMHWLREGFAPMLHYPAGTLWETWEPMASQCQATGAGPAFLFARYLGGLYPATPGYDQIGIDPHPAGLRHLRCRLTTPHGPVSIEWNYNSNMIDYILTLPRSLQNRRVITSKRVNLTIHPE